MSEELRRALDRAAGEDPRVDLTEVVWSQGRVVRRRRQATQTVGGLAAAAVMVGAFWLGGGLVSGPDALPGPAEPPTDDSAVSTVEEATDDTMEDPTEGGATDGETTDDGTDDGATTEGSAEGETTEETPEPPALPLDPCSTPYPGLVLQGEDLPEATVATADEILQLAAACDLDGLIVLAEQDETFLSFGVVGPQEAFSDEDGAERAAAIATVLTLFGPGQDADDAPYRWPGAVESDEDWTLVVDSGLYTEDEVEMMRDSGMGYTGWRVGVDAQGRWSFMVAGD